MGLKIKGIILFDNSCNFSTFALPFTGGLSEWLKERAWKARIPQKGIEGSNPSSSAHLKPTLEFFSRLFLFTYLF